MKPGSTLWLGAMEWRLMRRDLERLRGRMTWIVLALLAGMHLLAFAMKRGLENRDVDPGQALMILTIGIIFVFGLMLAKALTAAVQAIHGRRDLDLLFSAPLPAFRVVSIRMAGTALATAIPFAFLAIPFINVFALSGSPGYLGVYGLILVLALLASVLGFVLTLQLTRLIGVRRTEVAAQVIAAVFGAGAFLLSQVRVILPESTQEQLWLWVDKTARTAETDRAFWLAPARAASGDLGDLLLMFVGGVLFFALAARLIAPAVSAWARAASGASFQPPIERGRDQKTRIRFGGGARFSLLQKEWRLLVRNPLTLFHTLMKGLYLAPVVLVSLQANDPVLGIGGISAFIVAISAQLAAALAVNTINGEDAPDLVQAAPVPRYLLHQTKALAAILPALALALLASAGLAFLSLWAALTTIIMAVLACLALVAMELWHTEPESRTELRRGQNDFSALTLLETLLTVAFGAAGFLAAQGSLQALTVLALTACAIIILKPASRSGIAPHPAGELQR